MKRVRVREPAEKVNGAKHAKQERLAAGNAAAAERKCWRESKQAHKHKKHRQTDRPLLLLLLLLYRWDADNRGEMGMLLMLLLMMLLMLRWMQDNNA